MSYVEQKLGQPAIFLLPSLKLKKRSTEGILVEEEVHRFLMEHFGGYTAAAAPSTRGCGADDFGRGDYR
jgi:hypothetical protein